MKRSLSNLGIGRGQKPAVSNKTNVHAQSEEDALEDEAPCLTFVRRSRKSERKRRMKVLHWRGMSMYARAVCVGKYDTGLRFFVLDWVA